MDYEEKMKRCHEYIEALEVERQKIQVFQRELPLCLELVTQAIDACKKQLSEEEKSKEYFHAHQQQQQSETSEQTSGHHEDDVPIFEEFIPIKRSSTSSSDCDNDVEEKGNSVKVTSVKISNCCGDKSGKKSDWLRSVQLWNQTPDLPLKDKELPGKGLATDAKKKNSFGAFKPFNSKEKSSSDNNNNADQISTAPVNKSASSSSTETITGGSEGSKREEKEGQSSQSQRKQRRCWSPELHRRFLHSLQQLGGPHVATPKQIRELMKVDGLTNDEVKSHLQKYRLHTRRPSPSVHNNGNSQAPQFVVVGGIWVPSPEYAKMAPAGGEATGGSAANNSIYAPIATPAVPTVVHKEHKQQSTHRSRTDEGGRCSSPTSPSSTHTSTASPVY